MGKPAKAVEKINKTTEPQKTQPQRAESPKSQPQKKKDG